MIKSTLNISIIECHFKKFVELHLTKNYYVSLFLKIKFHRIEIDIYICRRNLATIFFSFFL